MKLYIKKNKLKHAKNFRKIENKFILFSFFKLNEQMVDVKTIKKQKGEKKSLI